MRFGFRLGCLCLRLLVTALLLVGSSVPQVYAQPATSTFDSDLPIIQVLNPDGTLNLDKGITGTLNLAGWDVWLDPLRGPRFARKRTQAHGGDDTSELNRPTTAAAMYSPLSNGVDEGVRGIAVARSKVYVGGYFTLLCGNADCNSGNAPANRIARWNASSWSTLGTGLSNIILAVAVSGKNVYVGGEFTQVCGNKTCHNIAQWNGSSWSSLGNGVNAVVRALAVSGSSVYAGGHFTQVCGNGACDTGNMTVNRIARWNGSAWSGLGAGVSLPVYSLAASGSNLYVGGQFLEVCGNDACSSGNTIVNRIAKWNGSSWSGLANGLNSTVFALAVSGTDVYAGGGFTQVCGNSTCISGNTIVNRTAKWNGSFWSGLGNGLSSSVQAFAISGSDLYVGGAFLYLCGNSACNSNTVRVNNLARWNGSSWSALGYGVNGGVYALGIRGSEVYLGGFFYTVCGNSTCTGPNPIVNRIASHPCESKPPAPALKSPPDNQTVGSLRPTLKWKPAPCADHYKVFVRVDATGTVADSATTNYTVLLHRTDLLSSGTTFVVRPSVQ